MEFKDIVMSRYATKKFTDKKLTQEQVDDLIELIRHSASSFNIQSWKIKIVSDKETLQKLYPATFSQPQILSCSHLLVFCADNNLIELADKIKQQLLDLGSKEEDIKDYIDMIKGYVSGMDETARTAYAREQVHIALGNAINGAKSLGFDSCPMGGFNPVEYSKILDLPPNIIPTVLCPIGYAGDEARPKFRFKKQDIVI